MTAGHWSLVLSDVWPFSRGLRCRGSVQLGSTPTSSKDARSEYSVSPTRSGFKVKPELAFVRELGRIKSRTARVLLHHRKSWFGLAQAFRVSGFRYGVTSKQSCNETFPSPLAKSRRNICIENEILGKFAWELISQLLHLAVTSEQRQMEILEILPSFNI